MTTDDDREHKCLASFEVCGCKAWVEVLGYGDDAGAYKEAAAQAKKGFRVETMTVAEWKAGNLWCPDHPKGPPWWKSRGGNGKRPAEYAPNVEIGL
jgi:hypothetical protein